MSLRHGLLGLLAEGPASGYDLARRFEQMLAPVWPARHPNIYSELNRMTAEGLIEVDSHGPRGRKAYRIADQGLAELRAWLTAGKVDHTVRMETILRSFFFWLMNPDELQGHLERERTFFGDTARLYRGYAAAADRGEYGTEPRSESLRTAIEAAARLYEALAAWTEWAETTHSERSAVIETQ